MSAQLHPETEWSAEDEEWMQEARQDRERERWERNSREDYRKVINSRNGQIVRLLVPHPFQDSEWRIIGPAEPGFYHLACRFQLYGKYNGFKQTFHQDEFTSQPV